MAWRLAQTSKSTVASRLIQLPSFFGHSEVKEKYLDGLDNFQLINVESTLFCLNLVDFIVVPTNYLAGLIYDWQPLQLHFLFLCGQRRVILNLLYSDMVMMVLCQNRLGFMSLRSDDKVIRT